MLQMANGKATLASFWIAHHALSQFHITLVTWENTKEGLKGNIYHFVEGNVELGFLVIQ